MTASFDVMAASQMDCAHFPVRGVKPESMQFV
jgi:hypothetical protein